MTARLIRRDRRGSTAVEFAITVPMLLALIFGTIQAGLIFVAIAGLKHGVGEAARLATLWPTRTDAQIRNELRAKAFGVKPANLSNPVITRSTSQGVPYAEISVSYTMPLEVFFLDLPDITLQESRRAYIP
jgi:Flp pilus assembly protein TadG